MDIATPATDVIVVGVDGSRSGVRAVGWAAEQAALADRRLALVHGIGGLGTQADVWLTESDPIVQERRERGEAVLAGAAALVRDHHPSVEVETRVVTDDPCGCLVAASEHAAMVVVGSRGRGPVRGRLLGSVSAGVTRHAHCPVVVVRPQHPGIVRRGVVVGIDGAGGSPATLEFAYRQASLHDLPLTVTLCVGSDQDSTTPREVPPDYSGTEAGRLLVAESIAGMTERFPEVDVSVDVEAGVSLGARLELASSQMDLVVVGRRRASAWSRAVSGDTALHVVEHGHAAIAVVPEGGDRRQGDAPGPTHHHREDLGP